MGGDMIPLSDGWKEMFGRTVKHCTISLDIAGRGVRVGGIASTRRRELLVSGGP
jgi:hypothetical protein